MSLYSSSQKNNFAILPAVETELKLSPRQPPWSSDCIFASHNSRYDFLNPASEHTGTEREEKTLWFRKGQSATRTQDLCVAGYHAEAIVAMMDPRTRDMGLIVSCLMFCTLWERANPPFQLQSYFQLLGERKMLPDVTSLFWLQSSSPWGGCICNYEGSVYLRMDCSFCVESLWSW